MFPDIFEQGRVFDHGFRRTRKTFGPVVVTEPCNPCPDSAGAAKLVRIGNRAFQSFRHLRIITARDPSFRGIEVESMDEFQREMNRNGGGVQSPVESDAGILRNQAEIAGGESVTDPGIGVFVIVVCLAGVNAAGEEGIFNDCDVI